MIRRRWKDPNYRVGATFRRGAPRIWLTRGRSAEAVRQRLEHRGWTVQQVKPFDFEEWKAGTAALTSALVEAYERHEKLEFNDDKWREMKGHLFELFDDKCAYCESKPRRVEPGDVEHYRPKGRVTEDVDHPGYYWLAYDVENLLPSCNECNRARGKWNQFPVEQDTRARTAAEIDAEKPLLLHPYHDNPGRHLQFEESGDVIGKTTKGTKSVEVFGLDREELNEARREAQLNLERDLKLRLIECDVRQRGSWYEVSTAQAGRLRKGTEQYSAALLAHLARFAARIADDKATDAERAASARDAIDRALRK